MRPFGPVEPWTTVVLVHWARLKYVLRVCENAGGCLGFGALATEGLLLWRTGHGPNAF